MKPDILKINQLVEIELNEGDIAEYLPSRIEEIKEQYLYISMPMRKGSYIPMRIGQEIRIIMCYKKATVGFVTEVVGRRREPIPCLIINKPEHIVPVNQKREYVRLDISLPVQFRIIDEKDNAEIKEGITIDISAGGALFYTKTEVNIGQKMEIKMQLSPKNTFSCYAHAIRVFKKRELEKNTIQVAVEFDGIDEAHRDRIFKFIFKKQRERIKKGIT
ncbi:MAG TPA: hypothetical protein DD791_00130 [Syntrophomonas sp.]|jgi:c-di-GMP-binding flagellar brake protein YcgR|nr:hypothetical protein [Syntrophomonas sp.]